MGEKQLWSILGYNVYNKLRKRCRGFIRCDIINGVLYLGIKYDEIEYNKIIEDVTFKMMKGDISSDSIVEDFIHEWKRYFFYIYEKKLFYPEERV